MDGKQLNHFKSMLEACKQTLEGMVSRTEEQGRTIQADAPDVADRAEDNYSKEFLFSLSANERRLLRMVETALHRIREGDFGQCSSCGNAVGQKRLEAVPWTPYCIRCQEFLEEHVGPAIPS